MAARSGAAMSAAAALDTRRLSKSFGALTVANGIDFRLERGARQALIGPNGAGKTSFVNLVTGALAPDAGHIHLDGAEITALAQAARVKRGLVRTFQVTQLFRGLSVLENVTLAVCERRGIGGDMWRPVGRHREAVEEAYALLEPLGLAADAARPVAQGAAPRRARRRCAVRRDRPDYRGGRKLACRHRCTDHRARHRSGFPPGAAHYGAGARAGIGRGSARADRRRPGRQTGLSGRAGPAMSEPGALVLTDVAAGYGETTVLEAIGLDLPESASLAVLGRNGVGKTTLLATIMGHTRLRSGSIRFADREIGTMSSFRRARLGIGFVPQEREIFRSLTVTENLLVAARAGRWSMDAVYGLFPALAERRHHRGDQLSGGE